MVKKSTLVSSILLAVPLIVSPQLVYADPQVTEEDYELGEEDMDEVIRVRGGQDSMSEALMRKRESMQIMDSVVAEDIGKLPTNNVVEALQFVPGVQVGTRAAGETASLSIRGLGQVASTVNGRSVFTAAGRGFALQDIPATMVAGLDVYKSASADMVEGGIGGVINVRTHRPFDFEGRRVMLAAKATYSDQASETDPNLSVMLSDRWETGAGDIGALVNVSYVETNYRDQVIWGGAVFPYDDDGTRLDSTPGEVLDTTDMSYNLVREAIGGIDDMGNRKRPALNISLEWAPTPASSYYFDAFYTGYRQQGNVEFLFFGTDSQPLLSPYEYFDGTNVVSRAHMSNPYIMTSSTVGEGHTDGYQYALGGEWNLTGNLEMRSEVNYQLSKFKSQSQILDVERYADELIVEFNDHGSGQPAVEIIGPPLTVTDTIVAAPYFDRRHEARGEGASWRLDFNYFRPLSFIESWQFGGRYDIREASSDNVDINSCVSCGMDLSQIDGLMTLTPGGFFRGNARFPEQWATPSADFLRNNIEFMRDTFTDYQGAPDYNPTEFFDIEEQSYALYGQATLRADIGSTVLDGVAGVRVVHTDGSLSGYELVDDGSLDSEPTMQSRDSSSTEILPNLTLRYQLTPDFQFRFNASRTVTRPAFGDLNPTLTLRPPTDGQSNVGEGNGGNAYLEAVKANNFDLGAEYYFGESSAIYATVFWRDITNWIVPTTVNETHDGQLYTVTRPMNSGDGRMTGAEVGFQYFPLAIPDWLQGIGVQSNYTFIDAFINDEEGERRDIEGVSRHSLSLILLYERGPFSARLSHIYRNEHLTGFNHAANMPPEIMAGSLNFTDFSMSYEITEDLRITFDATNILGETFDDYFGDPYLFNRDIRRYSTSYSIGIRYSL